MSPAHYELLHLALKLKGSSEHSNDSSGSIKGGKSTE
jgi:hypothetical protein